MSEKMKAQFETYLSDNPHVYVGFEERAMKAAKGRRNFGAFAIINILRWDTMVAGNDDYKINNNYAPYLAREFERRNPLYRGFFRKRRV